MNKQVAQLMMFYRRVCEGTKSIENIKQAASIFEFSMWNNNIELMESTLLNWPRITKYIDIDDIFGHLCATGNIKVCKWLAPKFKINYRIDNDYLLIETSHDKKLLKFVASLYTGPDLPFIVEYCFDAKFDDIVDYLIVYHDITELTINDKHQAKLNDAIAKSKSNNKSART